MNFIHLGFVIAGAAAMTLPIWIHLLLRQRAKVMEIGSIRFVKQVVRRTKSRQRIQRWLLLALRALAVILLGLLFARPYFPNTPADGRTREVAVLIDRSASMSVEHEDGRTAMENATRRVSKYIDTLGDQANVHIGLFDASGVQSISLSELKDVKAVSTGTRFDDAFAWATDLLAASDRADRSLLLLSDLQRSSVGQLNLSTFPPDVSVRIEDPAPSVTQNLAIETATPTQVELRPGVPIAIAVRVHNGGEFPVTDVTVTVKLKGPEGDLEAEQLLSLAASERKTIEMKLPIDAPGVYRGVVLIDRTDAFSWDNQRFVAFEAKHPDRLLLIDGDPGRATWENATYFLETSLRLRTPVGDGAPRTFEVERLVWDQGSGFPDLAGFRLIVIANIGRFTARDADRLKDFLEQGGNVLWFVGERTTNAVLDPIATSGVIGSTKFLPAVDTIANVTDFDRKHPVLTAFADPQHGDLRGLSARRLVPIESLDPGATILLRSRKWPLVVSHETGNGHFVLVMTSADRSWSDWPQSRLFVPLVRQFAAWLTGQLDAKQSVVIETIKDPAISPGIDEVSDSLVVRNVDPAESEIGRFGEEQFREAVQLPENSIVSDEADLVQQFAPAGVARSDEKWPFVIWMLLGILGVEFLLASRVHE